MPRHTRTGLVPALTLVVAACGGSSPTAPPATPAPTPTPTATAASSPAGLPALPEGPVPAGRYQAQPYDTSLTVTFDVPSGWDGIPEVALTIAGPGSDAPKGVAIAFIRADGLYADGCHWDVDGSGRDEQPGDVSVGPSVQDLVDALRANTSYTATAPTPVTFGQYQGQELDLELPASLPLAHCDTDEENMERFFVFSGPGSGIYSQGDGNRWHLSIVDVAGTRVIVNLLDYAGTPAADRAAAEGIVESIRFTP
jgi:hypothetical protein